MSDHSISLGLTAALVAAAALLMSAAARAQTPVAYYPPAAQQYAPAAQNGTDPDQDAQLDPRFQRQIVNYATNEAPGTVIIDTPHTYLYLVLGNGQAIRYGIGVGREGFTWSGVKTVARKAEWPDWYPPPEMIARQPYLPRMTAGGPGNPLGARAMYLGGTEYRIHGTNDPTTIGKDVSSGCIRLTNEDVEDLYNRVQIGAKVIVLPQSPPATVARQQQRAPLPMSYAQETPAGRTWSTIRPAGIY
ncbi:MAG TPA: L,D-transpeptidase [Pseudolabrys sp.]|nr:L,D-transpeptidase [Pseudolabrys sp.]